MGGQPSSSRMAGFPKLSNAVRSDGMADFPGIRSYVFKQSYAMAAESQKVPLEIFFNPTILSDDNLFSELSNFFTPSPLGREASLNAHLTTKFPPFFSPSSTTCLQG
jgi:hypothetical protein